MNKELSANEAATLCAVSDDTVRRRLKQGWFPRAKQDHGTTGRYRIPLADLVAAGMFPPAAAGAPETAPSIDEVADRTDAFHESPGEVTLAGYLARNEALTDEVAYLRLHCQNLLLAVINSRPAAI
jgi:hypothetical protein